MCVAHCYNKKKFSPTAKSGPPCHNIIKKNNKIKRYKYIKNNHNKNTEKDSIIRPFITLKAKKK